MEERNTVQRKLRQTQLVETLDHDLKTQAEKMQYLGQDIQEISNKVKRTRGILKENQALTKENHRLQRELSHYKNESLTLQTRLAGREQALQTVDAEVQILQKQLNEERAKNQDYNESLQSLTLRIRDESDATTTQINHLQNQIAHFQAQIAAKDDHICELKARHLNQIAAQDVKMQELKKAHLVQLDLQDRKIRDFNLQLEAEKQNFLDKLSTQKTENNQLLRTLDASNKDIALLQQTLQNTEKSLKFHQKFKTQYEDEKARNNCTVQNMRENLEMYLKMNTDYERCITKMQQMEAKIIQLTKENNNLRENLIIGNPSVKISR